MGNSELRMTTLQGEELWVSLSTSTVEVGEQRHRIFVFRDISAYKEVERLKSDFVSTVSHELRTPLASIKGYAATLLQRGARLPNNVRDEYLAIINHEADRLNGLVSDLLDVARLEQRQVRVEQRPTPLAPIARRVVDLARARTDRHRLELAVPPDLVAQAAPDRLEQVLTNLVENALKYSPRGGTVRVEGRRVDGHVALAVVDEGIGIAPERQGELFRPFARLESTLTRETEGAGLGLYICKQLVERMGGTIALASAPGRGTTVTVILAAAEPVLSAE